MKKQDLASLAMIGISAGLLIGGCQQKQQEKKGKNGTDGVAPTNHEQMSANMQSFYSTLSPEGQRKFMELDSKHRKMSMEMMEQGCKGKNACKGLGGCATDKNSCAGLNGCKGEGGPPIKSADKAVEAQHHAQMGMDDKKEMQTSGAHGDLSSDTQTNGTNGDLSPDMQTFYNELSPDAQRKFMGLDAQHKMMSIEMSKQDCSGKNACKGMGGCASDKNSCAGQNGCKGEGGAPVNDPDEAVEVQYRNQSGQNNQ